MVDINDLDIEEFEDRLSLNVKEVRENEKEGYGYTVIEIIIDTDSYDGIKSKDKIRKVGEELFGFIKNIDGYRYQVKWEPDNYP